jgi:putative copper export protein
MDRFLTAFIDQWIPIVNHWLHLMSAILWIGGLGVLMMAVVPSLRKTVPGELLKPLANAIYQKYQRIIGVLMLVLLVTGGVNIVYVHRLMKAGNGEGFTNPYIIALGVKLFFVMCLMTLFLYNLIFPPPPVEQGEPGEEERDPEGIPFLRPAFWFGIFIVLMASTLKHLHH